MHCNRKSFYWFFINLNIVLSAIMSFAQIGDFGMSRVLDSDYYVASGGVLPIRWSAPEVRFEDNIIQ